MRTSANNINFFRKEDFQNTPFLRSTVLKPVEKMSAFLFVKISTKLYQTMELIMARILLD